MLMVAVDSIINRNEKHSDLQFKVAASFIASPHIPSIKKFKFYDVPQKNQLKNSQQMARKFMVQESQ